MGNGLDLLAIPGDQMGTKEKCHAAPPTWRANSRCPDPVVRTQLVMMLRVPRPRWLMQEATQTRTGLSWFRPRGRMSSKGVCESTVLSCTGGACSRGYKRGERGREAPKSLLEEKLAEASANIGAQESMCAL